MHKEIIFSQEQWKEQGKWKHKSWMQKLQMWWRKIALAHSWGVCIRILFTWMSDVWKKIKEERISWNSKAESSRGSTMFGWWLPSISACVSLIITSCVRKWKERWNKEGLSYHQRLTRGHMSERGSHDSNTQPLASQKGTLELFLTWLWDLVCSTLKSLPSKEEIDTPKEYTWMSGVFYL